MQRVEEPMETIHLYVVREEEKRPYSLLPLFFAFLCLLSLVALTLYSGEHPSYEHETIRVPAILLPIKTFTTSVNVIPTGTKYFIATRAQGLLTLYNGSFFIQYMPKGVILIANNGVEVITDTSVVVPAGNPPAYGITTVPAHAMMSGEGGNIRAYAIDRVEGSSIYIRNLQSFTGGKDAYSITYTTPHDRLTALSQARATLHQLAPQSMLVRPCKEDLEPTVKSITVRYACQYVTYTAPVFFRVEAVKVQGSTIILHGYYLSSPRKIWAK